ncbi:hypothetical protein EVA_17541 [gut metagenome]|uniref:Uncharacterized protein n=1 Tax=gut metagenome TaxID=749906 RepID=J9FXS4_9ZZZZ
MPRDHRCVFRDVATSNVPRPSATVFFPITSKEALQKFVSP